MNQAIQTRSAPEAMIADIPYTPDTGEKLINETFGPGNIQRRRTGPVDMRPMRIHNGRLAAGEFSLERHGFRFVEHNQPIEANPLALADAQSVAFEDLMVAERRYPNRVGQTYRLRYNPAHRWFYFPRMRRDEALVFKVYDSLQDGRARFTPHTSFDDPNSPPDAPPRQSIEARALAFFSG